MLVYSIRTRRFQPLQITVDIIGRGVGKMTPPSLGEDGIQMSLNLNQLPKGVQAQQPMHITGNTLIVPPSYLISVRWMLTCHQVGMSVLVYLIHLSHLYFRILYNGVDKNT